MDIHLRRVFWVRNKVEKENAEWQWGDEARDGSGYSIFFFFRYLKFI